MRKHLCLLLFVLALALAYATSQTSPSSSTNQSSGQVKPTNPGGQEQAPAAVAQAGSSSQTAAASPGDAQSQIQRALNNDPTLRSDNIMVSVVGNDLDLTGEVGSSKEKDVARKIAEKYAGSMRIKDHLKVRGAQPGSSGSTATPPENALGSISGNANSTGGATTGGVAGSVGQTQGSPSGNSTGGGIGSNTSANPGTSGATGATTEIPSNAGENAISPGDLQAQIQNALRNEPTLSNNNVNVAVSEDQIDVSGAVATAKEKLTAKRIVQSYAGNRKVKDHLTVKGHSPENAGNPRDTQNPAGNPDQNKNNPRPGAQPPQPKPNQ